MHLPEGCFKRWLVSAMQRWSLQGVKQERDMQPCYHCTHFPSYTWFNLKMYIAIIYDNCNDSAAGRLTEISERVACLCKVKYPPTFTAGCH